MPRELHENYTAAEKGLYTELAKWLLDRCDGDREIAVNLAIEVMMVFAMGAFPTTVSAAAAIHEAIDAWVEMNSEKADRHFKASRPKLT